jgi:hypothetical protein
MPRKLLVAIFLTLTLATGFLAGRASAAQPHMVSARNHLQAALRELNLADRDKGGHRDTAVKLVNDAITEVNLGIGFGRRHGE